MEKTLFAVLTGDVVRSTKIKPEYYDHMLYTLESTFTMLSQDCDLSFDIYRGDSFQAVFPEPVESIKSALIVRLALKTSSPSFDARQSIGIGTVTSLRHQAKSSTGEAFTLSGTGLDNIKKNKLTINSNNISFQAKIELLTKFLDAQLDGLTVTQSEALLSYLVSKDKSHDAVATTLNKTRSNITRLLNASHYQLFVEYLNYAEECLKTEF